jgi:hypothetical protein
VITCRAAHPQLHPIATRHTPSQAVRNRVGACSAMASSSSMTAAHSCRTARAAQWPRLLPLAAGGAEPLSCDKGVGRPPFASDRASSRNVAPDRSRCTITPPAPSGSAERTSANCQGHWARDVRPVRADDHGERRRPVVAELPGTDLPVHWVDANCVDRYEQLLTVRVRPLKVSQLLDLRASVVVEHERFHRSCPCVMPSECRLFRSQRRDHGAEPEDCP